MSSIQVPQGGVTYNNEHTGKSLNNLTQVTILSFPLPRIMVPVQAKSGSLGVVISRSKKFFR